MRVISASSWSWSSGRCQISSWAADSSSDACALAAIWAAGKTSARVGFGPGFADGQLGQVDGRISGPADGIDDDALQAGVRFRMLAYDRGLPVTVLPPTR